MPAYNISSDEPTLAAALTAVSPKIVSVQFLEGIPRIDTSEDLTQQEIDAIKTIIAVRFNSIRVCRESGPNFLQESSTAWDFRACATNSQIKSVVSPTDWEEVARVITTPGFFNVNADLLDVYAIGDYKSTGSGAEIRITEEPCNPQYGSTNVIGSLSLADTGGAWKVFSFDGYPVRLFRCRYRLEVRTGAALDVALVGFSMSLLEAK